MVNDYVWTFNTVPPLGPPPVDLASADAYGILAGVGISNNAGFSEIHDMNVGISPGVRSSVTGFPPAVVINGAIYCSDDVSPPGIAALLIQAKQDLTNAYLAAEGASSPAPVTVSGDIGGTTLAPGIYKSTSTLMIQSGDLTLDAQGDIDADLDLQVSSAFTNRRRRRWKRHPEVAVPKPRMSSGRRALRPPSVTSPSSRATYLP